MKVRKKGYILSLTSSNSLNLSEYELLKQGGTDLSLLIQGVQGMVNIENKLLGLQLNILSVYILMFFFNFSVFNGNYQQKKLLVKKIFYEIASSMQSACSWLGKTELNLLITAPSLPYITPFQFMSEHLIQPQNIYMYIF